MFVFSLIALVSAIIYVYISTTIADKIEQPIAVLIALFFLSLSLIFAPVLIKLLIAIVLLLIQRSYVQLAYLLERNRNQKPGKGNAVS
jgi:fucose 4-O-acetylase-like acetyltransferase